MEYADITGVKISKVPTPLRKSGLPARLFSTEYMIQAGGGKPWYRVRVIYFPHTAHLCIRTKTGLKYVSLTTLMAWNAATSEVAV